jgi:hypothetical protein
LGGQNLDNLELLAEDWQGLADALAEFPGGLGTEPGFPIAQREHHVAFLATFVLARHRLDARQ